MVDQRVFELEERGDGFVNMDDEADGGLAIIDLHPHSGHVMD